MALKIEYETAYGITCEEAICVIIASRCTREIEPNAEDSGDTSTKTHPVEYSGYIYANQSAYDQLISPIGGFNGKFGLNISAAKTQYNIIKQCYIHLKTQDGFTDGVDC